MIEKYSFGKIVVNGDTYTNDLSFAPPIKGLRLTIIFSFYFFLVVKGSQLCYM